MFITGTRMLAAMQKLVACEVAVQLSTVGSGIRPFYDVAFCVYDAERVGKGIQGAL